MPYVIFVDRTDATFNVAKVVDINTAHVKVHPLVFDEGTDAWTDLDTAEDIEIVGEDIIGVTTLSNKRLTEQEQGRYADAVVALTSPYVIAVDLRNGKTPRAAKLVAIFPKIRVQFASEEDCTTLESVRCILGSTTQPVVTPEHIALAATRFAAKQQRDTFDLFSDTDEQPQKIRKTPAPTATLQGLVALDMKRWPELTNRPEQRAQFKEVWRTKLPIQTGGVGEPAHVLRERLLDILEALMLMATAERRKKEDGGRSPPVCNIHLQQNVREHTTASRALHEHWPRAEPHAIRTNSCVLQPQRVARRARERREGHRNSMQQVRNGTPGTSRQTTSTTRVPTHSRLLSEPSQTRRQRQRLLKGRRNTIEYRTTGCNGCLFLIQV